MKSNILLEGDIGTGKTYSLRTLLPHYFDYDGRSWSPTPRDGAGRQTFLVSLEPGAEATLGPNLCSSDNPCGIHLHYIEPLALTWDQFRQYASILNSMPLDKALEVGDTNKRRCTQFLDIMDTCGHFVCDRCGYDAGDAGEWTDEYALALDGMTGLTTVARHLCVGLKPILSRPEYNPVMGMVEGFLDKFWGSTRCTSILLSHVDREVDPTTGRSGLTVHTIGQKLAPRVVKKPDEIIVAEYDEGKFTWATELPGHITKVRNMPRGNSLPPNFSLYGLFDAR